MTGPVNENVEFSFAFDIELGLDVGFGLIVLVTASNFFFDESYFCCLNKIVLLNNFEISMGV